MTQHIYSIAPHAPFLPTLVEAILHGPLLEGWSRASAFWLSDVTIILPTRRARLQLSQAFAEAMGGSALLPDIRTLGALEGDENLFFEEIDPAGPANAVSDIDRQFLLGELVEKWLAKNKEILPGDLRAAKLSPARIFALADSLGQLIDDLNTEGVSVEAVRDIPALDLNAERQQDLALNFQQNLKFLEIILSAWPNILDQRGQVDVSRLKNLRVEQEIKRLDELYGHRPIIVAGSTGSVPATAKLLGAIVNLPRGRLVLPGLDTSLSKQSQMDLLNAKLSPHGHPQYGLSHLLKGLGTVPELVEELGGGSTNIRSHIVREALALAKDTAHWNYSRQKLSQSDIEEAITGIAIAVTKTEQEQALVVALAARDALQKNQSVGIITPDRNFARRVAIELKRFDIIVDDSAGTPLYQSRTGRLVRQILSVGVSNFSAIDMMALLRNRYVRLGGQRSDIAKISDLIEFALLRGQRPATGIKGLHELLKKNLAGELPHAAQKLDASQGQKIATLLGQLEKAFTPLLELLAKPDFSAASMSQTICIVLDKLSEGVDQKTDFLSGLHELNTWARGLKRSTLIGPSLNAASIQTVLPALMAKISVRFNGPGHKDISIWGRLEARLQSADLMILCTLNEGVWPEIADPGPWMSRSMRLHAGLEPPERQQGLAAHDFEMAIGHENVLLTYAKRLGTSPALPSRLVERLCTYVGDSSKKMHQRADKWLALARTLDKTAESKPLTRPAPSPPAHMRPKSISITEVETLIRSPYDLYAKYVLGLRAIDPLGQDVGMRERGTLVHEVFAQFVQHKFDPNARGAHAKLMGIAKDVFGILQHQPEQRDIWLRRFQKSAVGFIEFERARSQNITRRFAEIDLHWSTPPGVSELSLRGRADRIDLCLDGRVEILDFKTGSIPQKNEMKSFLAPQLLIESAIIAQNGFEDNSAAATNSIAYIKIGADPAAFSVHPFELPTDLDVNGAAIKMLELVQARAQAFLNTDNVIMSPRIMPKPTQNYAGNYDHLARTDEWSLTQSSEEI